MSHPAEARICAPTDADVCAAIKLAFPGRSDQQVIAELARIIVFVAVSYNDVVEDSQPADEVFERRVFADCDQVAGYFPWPDE